MAVEPDYAGFDAAMRRLREPPFATPVTFHKSTPPVWPAGTALDPETGEPLDPYVEPVSGGGTEDVVVNASLVNRPLARLLQSERLNDPIGWIGGDTLALILDPEDGALLASGTSAQPTHCTLIETRFMVQDFRLDETHGSKSTIVYCKKG